MSVDTKLAMVFPGQGSQKIGMLSDFSHFDIVRSTFNDASESLEYDLWDLIQNAEQNALNMTEITQPALLTSSVALWRLWKEQKGILPSLLAGHSLGEWSALVAAEVVSLKDAVKLVQSRGKYMQEAVPAGQGAMAAIIGLDDDLVEKVCTSSQFENEVCSPVNYNSPGQLVIAGSQASVERAIIACKDAGAKRALPLPVSAPFHTSLMKPAADRLAQDIHNITFSQPLIPVVHNVNAKIEHDTQIIKDIMIEQIYSPVRWVDCVRFLAQNSVAQIVEMGPGKVLSGLVKRIDKSIISNPTETVPLFETSILNLKC